MNKRELFFRTLAAAIVCAAAAWAWSRLLGPIPTATRIVPSVLLVALAGWWGTAGGRRVTRGIGTLVALGMTFLCGLVLGAMTLSSSNGTAGPSSFFKGVIEGLGILLTSPVPAPADAETVTAAIIFSGYLTAIACVLVWTRAPATCLIPGFLLFLGATSLSQGSTESALPSGIIFSFACLLMLAMVPKSGHRGAITDGVEFAEPERERSPGRHIFRATVAISLVAIVFVGYQLALASGLGTSRPPFDPHRSGDYRPKTDVNTVDQVQTWQTVAQDEKQPIMTVKGKDLTSAMWWATSEAYNGTDWFSRKSYDNVGTSIPYDGPRRTLTRPVSAAITTSSSLEGPWLPTIHCATTLTGLPIRANSECDIVSRSNVAADASYKFTSATLAPSSMAALINAGNADWRLATVASELPIGFPAGLAAFADANMDSNDKPFERLLSLANALGTSEFAVSDADTYNAFSYQTIDNLVVSTRRGSQAQYATAFALMARYKGFSARLAAGFRLPSPSGGTVTSRQAMVWPEVKMTQAGWVPFAPGPAAVRVGVPVPKAYKPTPAPAPKPKPTPPPPTPTPTPPTGDSGVPGVVVAALTGLAILIGWIVLVALWRSRQRRRLEANPTTSPPRFGPWSWVIAVRLHERLPVPLSPGSTLRGEPLVSLHPTRRGLRRTTAQPSAPAAVEQPTQALVELAGLAQPALYGPTAPESVDARAWVLADVDTRTTTRRSITTRLRWWLLPLRIRSADEGTDLTQLPQIRSRPTAINK